MMSNTTIVGLINDIEVIDDDSMNLIVYVADDEYDTRVYTSVDDGEGAFANSSSAVAKHKRSDVDIATWNDDNRKNTLKHGTNPTKANLQERGEKLIVHCTGFFS